MSLASATVRGSAWVMATSIGARVLGVAGTLALTRYLAPEAYGEVQAAWVVAATASQFATLGLGQYLISNPKSGREMAFHATALHVSMGAVALLLAWVLERPLGILVNAPGMVAFLPGMLVSTMLDRFAFIPERILIREMRFRDVGVSRTLGELAYTAVSVGLAMAGWGGLAIVVGNIGRSLFRMAMMARYAPFREWASPTAIRVDKLRELFAFGLPLSLAGTAGFAARRWDNLLISALFGPSVMGTYNLAYNLADIPATQVGEQITDVLLPSFARVDVAKRVPAFVRSMRLVSLLMTPLAVGLGAVAPTLVRALFDERWTGLGSMLASLAALSAVRPLAGVMQAFLQTKNRTRAMLALEVAKLVLLVVLIVVLGKLAGPLAACTAVGIAFFVHVVLYYAVVRMGEDLPYRHLVSIILRPALACVPMIAAVLGVRVALSHLGIRSAVLGVGLESLAGAAGFGLAALVVARETTRDFVSLISTSFLRRRKRAG